MEKELTSAICKLVTFLVANVSKNESEWREWGLPFVRMIVRAQFEEEESEGFLQQLQNQFCPMIGQGVAFMVVDCPDSGYVVVHHSDAFIQSIMSSLDLPDQQFESVLSQFLNNMFESVFKKDAYDSRSRNVAKRMCIMLSVSAKKLGQIEQAHWQSAVDGKDLQLTTVTQDFSNQFNSDACGVDRTTLLTPFRLWRVAFMAAGGGAIMAVASRLAAPTVIETVVGLLFASSTVGQVSLALNAVLGCVGLTTATVPYVLGGGYGAGTAGYRMLRRMDALQEFLLEPLHQSATASAKLEREPEDARQGVPVFIVVSGHVAKGVDPRTVWGANGTVSVTTSSKTESEVPRPADSPDAQPAAASFSADLVRTLSSVMVDDSEEGATSAAASATSADGTSGAEEEALSDWEELKVAQGWWCDVVLSGDEYILHWERALLESLNESFQKILTDKFRSMVYNEVVKNAPIIGPYTAIKGAFKLPMFVMGKIKELDDPWCVAMDRSRQAGVLLARVLMEEHGRHRGYSGAAAAPAAAAAAAAAAAGTACTTVCTYGCSSTDEYQSEVENFVKVYANSFYRGAARPVTLVGYGMGARLVFHCLEELAAHGARGIVENAVLIGTPVGSSPDKWAAVRSVVADRLINCYATNDWVLAILYRCKSYEMGVAGLVPISLPQQPHQTANVATATATAAAAGEGGRKIDWSAAQARVHEVENVDVSHMISCHSDYPSVLPTIIAHLKL